jgi:hypothetical protein
MNLKSGQHNADRNVEGLQTSPRKIVGQLLDPRLMADGRPWILRSGRRFGGVFASMAFPGTLHGIRDMTFRLHPRDNPGCGLEIRLLVSEVRMRLPSGSLNLCPVDDRDWMPPWRQAQDSHFNSPHNTLIETT